MKQITFLIGLLLVSVGTTVLGDPPIPPKHHWRNSQHAGHYVLYDAASRTYIETVGCKALWKFKEVTNELNRLTLHDASRNMTMQLTYDAMYLKANGATTFTKYQNGTFDKRQRFSHYQNGNYTGALSIGHACSWVEYLAGATSPSWRFVETASNASSIRLYDAGRKLSVILNLNEMWLQWDGKKPEFFKKGNW